MTHPLLEQLQSVHHYPLLSEAEFDQFIQQAPFSVLFFTESETRFPESLDVAVILPELVKLFPQLSPAVVSREAEGKLQGRYNFNAWPALVFLKEGKYLGAITRVQNWDDYMRDIDRILQLKPQRNPGIGIPVVSATDVAETGCGH